MNQTLRRALAFAVCAAALAALFFVAVNTGSLKVAPGQLLRGLFVAFDEDVATIYDLRLPRIFIALLAGAATAVSGALLQAAIRNPLADPGLIGISAGASLAAVVVSAVAPALLYLTPALATLGGVASFLLVYGLSWQGGLSPLRIILVGVALSSCFTGLMSALDAGTGSTLSGVASLVEGNITMKTWGDLAMLAAYAVPGLLVAWPMARRCDLLALEDKQARGLGFDVDRNRMLVSFVAVLLASISTAVVGPISFLGLIVPHCARILVGTRHAVLIPFCMLLGALCLLAADTLGRTVAAPYEISAAIVMSIVGCPAFIALLKGARSTYGE